MTYEKDKQLHHEVGYVGLRAQATAVGLLQLCIELQAVGVIDQAAVVRIKETIAKEISLSAPRSIPRHVYQKDVLDRLDRLFAGEEQVGSAEALAFGAAD